MQPKDRVCTSCGHANQSGSRFCSACGSPLAAVCPGCGAENLPGSRFCNQCGMPLTAAPPAAAPSPAQAVTPSPATPAPVPAPSAPASTRRDAPLPEEERRLVTVLFCDLVGFTPLSEQLDPEDVRDIQAAYFERMSEQIERFSGTVEKYAGDAVLALFGAPIAHEDDAERAVLCALGMQAAIEPVAAQARARWSIEPALRVGVNTGDVVSGAWNAGGRQDVAVTGDAVNTAARIQAAAEPGEVLVGLETMRLTKRRIQYGERRDLTLKGKMGTVPGYAALGLREQFGERWETSQQATPLVGRDREMLQLLDAWIRAQGGDGQLVTLMGDAGVGKSRLISEVLDRVGANTALRVLRGRCLSYGQEISLWLIADLLRTLVGLKEQDALDEARTKLSAVLTSLLTGCDAATQAEACDVLGEVLGMAPEGSRVTQASAQVRRQTLIRSLRLVLRALSERAAFVLVLEDLHWLDEASEEVLTEVLSDVPGLRVLVIAAQRPGSAPPWTEWGWTERMSLRPLKDEEATLLAGAVLGGVQLSPELQRYVSDRAGGNPFFVEEMLHALDETGNLQQRNGLTFLAPGAAERLPSTLTEVLLARLDRLESTVRTVAQVASVIGRSFAVRLLAHVLDTDEASLEAPLTALQRAEIAFPRRGSDLEYVFKHVSMREVAYNTLVQKRRQALHLKIARAIADMYPTDEYVEMIAYHYSRTEEHVDAAEWLQRAGDRAAGVFANETAVSNYAEALKRLQLTGAEAQRIAVLNEKIGEVYLRSARYDEAVPLLQQAAEDYRRLRDLEGAGRATALLTDAQTQQGKGIEAITTAQSMIDLLSWTGPSPALALMHISISGLFFNLGRYSDMKEASDRAIEIATALGDERLLGRAHERRGTSLCLLGRMTEAADSLERAVRLLEEHADLAYLHRALNNLGESYRVRGNLSQAIRYNERAIEVSERSGEKASFAFGLINIGEILIRTGAWADAQSYLERSLDVLRTVVSSTYVTAYPPLMLGQLAVQRGHADEAAEHFSACLAVVEQSEDRQAHDSCTLWQAELDLLEGRPESARDRVEPLHAAPDSNPAVILPVLARAYIALGRVDEAVMLATEAVRDAESQGEQLYSIDAQYALALTLSASQRWTEALQVVDAALPITRQLPFPLGEGRFLVISAEILQRQLDSPLAQERLDEAIAIFRRLGAEHDLAHAEGLLSAVAQ